MSKTIVRFALVKGWRTVGYCWIKSLSYADGDGMKAKRMTTTKTRSEAARFSTSTAYGIALQFSQYPAALELADGGLLVEDTARLQAEQHSKHAAAVAAANAVRSEFEQGLREILTPALRQSLGL